MRSWIFYLGLIVFGVIWILLGLSLRHPEPWFIRVGFILVGGLFAGLGAVALRFGDRQQIIPALEPDDRRRESRLGLVIALFSAIAAVYIVVAYPFDAPQWQGQAWWIRWVFVVALLWFLAAGVFLIAHARGPGDRESASSER